jgi:hypothetical protein
MKFLPAVLLFLSPLLLIFGCSKGLTEEEINTKIQACTEKNMGYTYLKDYRKDIYEIVCVSSTHIKPVK